MSVPVRSRHSLLYRLGGFAAGHPWRVLAAWVVAIALVVGLWAALGADTSDDITIPGMPSQQALDLLEDRFPAQAGGRAVAVFGYLERRHRCRTRRERGSGHRHARSGRLDSTASHR
jgi:hypothetical protein